MRWDDVVNWVAENQETFLEACRRISKNSSSYEDLFQSVFLSLMEYKHKDYIISLHEQGRLKFFILGIIRIQWGSSRTSTFAREYKHFSHALPIEQCTVCFEESDFMFTDESQAQRESELEKFNAVLDEMYWFDRELFKAYVEHGSSRKLSKATGIPSTSIRDYVRKVKEHVKSEMQ